MIQSITSKIKVLSPRHKKLFFLCFVALAVFILTITFFKSKSKSPTVQGTSATSQKSIEVNKDFTFPVSNTTTDMKLKFTIQKADITNQIVVKGQSATAVAGRTFLIVNLKIVNDFNQTIQINTRDYIRLSVNGSEELLAPDIHNDPVEVQAISTKYTRVGFPVNTTDKNFVLQIGEIKGDKEKINLNL